MTEPGAAVNDLGFRGSRRPEERDCVEEKA